MSAKDKKNVSKRGVDKKNEGYKHQKMILLYLRGALDAEKKKCGNSTVGLRYHGGHQIACGWGCVVSGYFLLEQSLKGLLHVRGKSPEKTHSLCRLLESLEDEDREVLEKFYEDCRRIVQGPMKAAGLDTLEKFFVWLDGENDEASKGFWGEARWRYFLIEKAGKDALPAVDLRYLHEVVEGCVALIGKVIGGRYEPLECVLSKRIEQSDLKKKRIALLRSGGEEGVLV